MLQFFIGGYLATIVDSVKVNFETIISDAGYEMYDIEYVKEGSNYFLRIFIDKLIKEEKINLEDCIAVNALISEYLDREDPITGEYMLEITSPGIIRNLKTIKHYQLQIGNEIEVKLYKLNPNFSSKKVSAILEDVSDEGIIIEGQQILFNEIAKGQTTFKF